MKLNQLLLTGVTSCLAASVLSVSGYAVGVSANPSSNIISPSATSTESNAVVAQNQTVAISSGTFVAAEKPTTGTARITTQNGHRYLEFDPAFSTSNQRTGSACSAGFFCKTTAGVYKSKFRQLREPGQVTKIQRCSALPNSRCH